MTRHFHDKNKDVEYYRELVLEICIKRVNLPPLATHVILMEAPSLYGPRM